MALRILALFSLVLVACAPVSLPDAPDDPSIYAGWKAGAACSAIFLAGRAPKDVLVDELGGMPPGADAIPDPVVDFEARTVAASYAPDRPPRLAAYREGVGCTTLPPGATLEDVATLPRIERVPPREIRPAPSGPTAIGSPASPLPTRPIAPVSSTSSPRRSTARATASRRRPSESSWSTAAASSASATGRASERTCRTGPGRSPRA